MAHRISIQNGKAEFAYTGADPWHGLGTPHARHLTPAEAVAAVLPWTVSLRAVRYADAGGAFTVDGGGARVIARDDTNVKLGIATDSYHPIQNAQAGDVVEALVAEGAQCVETIGALDDGARCFCLVALSETGFEVKRGDRVMPYFLLAWGHDGRTPLRGKLTATRVVCHNTLTAAGSAYDFSVHHKAGAKLRIDEAREALGLARQQVVKAQEAYASLAAAPVATSAAARYFAETFPAPSAAADGYEERLARWTAVQERLLSFYAGAGKGAAEAGPTAWGAYNAVTEYLDHVYPVLASGKVSQDRQQSVLFGSYAAVRDSAYVRALALV